MQAADAGDQSILVYVSHKSVRMALLAFPVEERFQVLDPDESNFLYRKEVGWRNDV